jgi:LmbE family N-acetylglucosaminyl deacetylase
MKIRVYFRPWFVVAAFGIVAVLLCAAAAAAGGWWVVPILPLAAFYALLFAGGAWALWRMHTLEHWTDWDNAERLLVLAPHEDDCAISAGGIAVRNHRLGGATSIVYLARDETPGMADRRAQEAYDAWTAAGLPATALRHLDLLPPLRRRDPVKLRAAAETLRSIIDDFQPTVVIVPMFEGGHVHHDQLAGLLDKIVAATDRFKIFEAPEYSPYVSLRFTPHRALALMARWLFGLVVYHGEADGVDDRPVLRFRLTPDELNAKRRVLSAFASQNGEWLAATRSYPDRLVHWRACPGRRHPFPPTGSYRYLARALRRVLPTSLAAFLMPADDGTIGRDGTITDWQEEWAEEKSGGTSSS